MNATRRRLENLVMRIQTAFLDDPDAAMTEPAARERFGIDGVTCNAVLGVLVDAGVLTERGGAYIRQVPGSAARRAA